MKEKGNEGGKRGRQRMRWLDNLKESTGKDLIELKEIVQD